MPVTSQAPETVAPDELHDEDRELAGFFGVSVHEDVLREPMRWRKPRKVFVNSMSAGSPVVAMWRARAFVELVVAGSLADPATSV
ncbi:hypothetical protein ACGFIV_24645 [Sphaerisporangium sp. NPDC049003]|uniref:hypothetical protein n=1 Tax=Sphaerisporangium sp. NPDC049003 TaxID=3364517 RepID=UPI00371557D8